RVDEERVAARWRRESTPERGQPPAVGVARDRRARQLDRLAEPPADRPKVGRRLRDRGSDPDRTEDDSVDPSAHLEPLARRAVEKARLHPVDPGGRVGWHVEAEPNV